MNEQTNNHKTDSIVLGGGCFWCVEAQFKMLNGVDSVISGYAGGTTINPTYKEVCTGLTGHAEVVKIIYNPDEINLEKIFEAFWQSHDPTQLNRQGNDIGTQYRSAIYVDDDKQRITALASHALYQQALTTAGHGSITTEIADAPPFYYAEDYHQQYLAKNPAGYCGLGGTGVSCPAGPGDIGA